MGRGTDIEELLDSLPPKRFINFITNYYVEEKCSFSEEPAEDREKMRAQLTTMYKVSSEDYSHGVNDNLPHNGKPLPFIPPTEMTDDGYTGLEPPVG